MPLSPDLAFIVSDADIGAQEFCVYRKTGRWVEGRLEADAPIPFTALGVIQPVSSEELRFFPEGEKREGMIVIYTQTQLRLTDGEDVSDVVTWRGEQYKVIRVDRWEDWGYCAAYAQKR